MHNLDIMSTFKTFARVLVCMHFFKFASGDHVPMLISMYKYVVEAIFLFRGLFDETYSNNFYKCMTMHNEIYDRCKEKCSLICKNHLENIDTSLCKYDTNMRWYANFYSIYNNVLYELNNVCKFNVTDQQFHNIFDKNSCLNKYFIFDDIDESCVDWIQHFGCGESECPCRKTMYETSKDVYKLVPCELDIFKVKNELVSIILLIVVLLFWTTIVTRNFWLK